MLFQSTLPLRFWQKVYADASGCWLWMGARHAGGYGSVFIGPTRDTGTMLAHRFAYERLIGPIPDGMELDHLCRNRACVNVFQHLEIVTPAVNRNRGVGFAGVNARKDACYKGHPFDLFNTRITVTGGRFCRECRRQRGD